MRIARQCECEHSGIIALAVSESDGGGVRHLLRVLGGRMLRMHMFGFGYRRIRIRDTEKIWPRYEGAIPEFAEPSTLVLAFATTGGSLTVNAGATQIAEQ